MIVYIIATYQSLQSNAVSPNAFPGLAIISKKCPLKDLNPSEKQSFQVKCNLDLYHQTTELSCHQYGHLLNMLLFSVTVGKQKDLVLFDFQKIRGF